MNENIIYKKRILQSKNAIEAYYYAKDIINGRWPEAETFIMKDPGWAYYYANDIIKGRWNEAEPFIMKDPNYAYYYALEVIKGRWIEAEQFIIIDPVYSYFYAIDIIKGRYDFDIDTTIDIYDNYEQYISSYFE